MDVKKAQVALTALAQPTRLKAFRRLLAAHPATLMAGDIARSCKVPHNTMSTHLAALTRAKLIAVVRQGRRMNYRADIDDFRGLVGFLMNDCCQGRPEICAPLLGDMAAYCRRPAASQRSAHG